MSFSLSLYIYMRAICSFWTVCPCFSLFLQFLSFKYYVINKGKIEELAEILPDTAYPIFEI